jgi:hypothetical protein
MKLARRPAQKSGLDIRSSKYSYSEDPVLGFTSLHKHADRWVNSTCGYCSVGCGVQLGVKDRRVVSVRGNPDHPVNSGKHCPKGPTEHYASSLPAADLHNIGLWRATDIVGGLQAWRATGLPTEPPANTARIPHIVHMPILCHCTKETCVAFNI